MPALLLALWALLAQLCPPATAAAPTLRRAGADAIAARPGEVVTAAVSVASLGEGQVLAESLDLPAGWAPATPAGRLQLEAGGKRLRVLAFQVAADAPAGDYTVRYTVTDARDPDARADIALVVSVGRVSGLTVELVGEPPVTTAGDALSLAFRVTNVGSAAEPVRFVVTPEDTVHVDEPRVAFDLAARASREVPVELTTSADEARPTTRIVRVEATSPTAHASAVAVVPVVPRPGRVDTWRRYPARASLAGTTDAEHVALQPSLEGDGAVDRRGDVTAALLLRPVDADGTGAFALRDELRLDLAARGASLAIGDHVFGLSPLTSAGRYGRGVGLDVDGRWAYARAFGALERFHVDPEAEVGAAAGIHLGEEGRVGVQVLGRGLDEPGSAVASVLAEARIGPSVRVESEAATDLVGADDADAAGSVALLARLPSGFAATVREVAAGPDFDGQERDVHRTVANLAVPFAGRHLTASGAFYREQRNLDLDPDRGAAPVEDRGDARLMWMPDSRWAVEAGAAAAVEDDLRSDDGWSEVAGRLQVVRTTSRLYASAVGMAGLHRDAEAGDDAPGAQLGAYLAWSPTPTLDLRARIDWGSDERTRSTLFATETSASLGARWRPAPGLDTELEGRRRLDTDTVGDQVDARVSYTARAGTSLAARYRLVRASVPDQSALLSVSVPFRVPVARLTDVGRLEGRVVDADAPGRPGLAGVVLRAGTAVARTGADGSFVFPRLPAGVARVDVDRATLGFDRVGVDALPATVDIPGGGRAALEIATTRAATLHGRVVLVGWSATDADEQVLQGDGTGGEERPGSGLTIVVTRGEERYTRVTDEHGGFTLDGLRPGAWSVTLPKSQVPRFYTAPSVGRTVALAGGEVADVELSIEPMVRLIHFVDSPALVVEHPLATEATRVSPGTREIKQESRRTSRWGHATVRGEATVTRDGTFLGGELVYELWDTDGLLACEARADWYDDGRDLPEGAGIENGWATSAATGPVRLEGPACEGIAPGDVPLPAGPWAWVSRDEALDRVLLRWDGENWVPVADDVDPLAPMFLQDAPLPR